MRILLFLFYTFSLSAQISGTIVNEKYEPIPYVNIWVQDENIGTTSQENGTFTINISKDKTVVFSAVSYETKKIKIPEDGKVVLKEAAIKLDEVVIEKIKQTKELEIGDMERIHHTQLSGDKPWIYAKLFNYEEKHNETPFIKNIVFYSDSEIKDAKLKIRVFQLQDSLPGIDLVDEDIIVSVKRGFRKNTVDVSKYKLKIPKNGIVVGLEWLIIPDNFYDYTYKAYKTKEKISMPNYAPSLVINYFDDRRAFQYWKGKWYWLRNVKTTGNRPWNNKVMTPAINLILTN